VEFVFLGTSAGEQFPGFWCKCEMCEKARRLGGRNIRRNSCAWLAPDCAIDFSPGVFHQADRFGVPLIDIRYLLVTHSHEDHLGMFPLYWRRMRVDQELPAPITSVGPRFSPVETLHVVGNSTVCAKVEREVGGTSEERAMEVHQVAPYEPFELGPMVVTPLVANHPDHDERGYNYIIERDGRTILYALDTGWFLPETLAEIERHEFDLMVIEGTFGLGADEACHMNLAKVERAFGLFRDKGVLKAGAPLCVSHMCPHATPVHDEIAPVMAEKGITIAYDGMRVDA